MRRFFFRTWGSKVVMVEDVDTVEFAPGYVVFYDQDGGILLAQANADCLKLREQLQKELTTDEARERYVELTSR